MGKSHVIVSINELLSVCNMVALALVVVGGAEVSGWAGLFDWWVDFRLTMNSKCICHFTDTGEEMAENRIRNDPFFNGKHTNSDCHGN